MNRKISTRTFYCPQCNLIFNKNQRKPIVLDCSDTVCLECYHKNSNNGQLHTFACKLEGCGEEIEVRRKPIINKVFLQQLKDDEEDLITVMCTTHLKENAKYYCEYCNTVICEICFVKSHNQHLKLKGKDYLLDRNQFSRYS